MTARSVVDCTRCTPPGEDEAAFSARALNTMSQGLGGSQILRIAGEIKASLANKPLQLREAAVASFDSYVKKMVVVLAYLDRFYTERLSLAKLPAVAAPVQVQLRMDLQVPAPVDVA